MKMPFREAGWLWCRVLPAINCIGITMPWGVAYLLKPWFHARWLRKHELMHLRQIRRDGPVCFTVRYLWFLAWRGYRNNPYEIEAYAVASPPEN
jgi:hypothetical protein